MREPRTGLSSLTWVPLSYLLTQTIMTVTAGRIADMVGRKRLYVGGFTLFTAVSFLAGFATDVGELIADWAIMGLLVPS